MPSEMKCVALTSFREQTAQYVNWVKHWGGHLWLTRHGRPIVGVVPFHEMEVLERVLDRNDWEQKERMEEEYRKFRAAKTIQARAERARLEAGLGLHGPVHTEHIQRNIAQGYDPLRYNPSPLGGRVDRLELDDE
ncbi:MAG: hypothetical protein QNJ09_15210 [Paracoccaceae bacterium]|nr:hypothetical protein [Paracoccaceae bacterium]